MHTYNLLSISITNVETLQAQDFGQFIALATVLSHVAYIQYIFISKSGPKTFPKTHTKHE